MPQNSELVHIVAPLGRDSHHIDAILRSHEIRSEVVAGVKELALRLGEATGVVVITEEGSLSQDWPMLLDALARQPSWSAYPFVFIVSNRKASMGPASRPRNLPPEVSNVMMLERPMGSLSLVSAVRWALAGRRRQFQTRDHLAELEQNARQQRLLTRELAHRVKNTIAVLQSIVSQTLKGRPGFDDVERLLIERFAALARAHDLLLSTDFQRSDFRELLETSLYVHVTEQDRIILRGPSIDISPQAALSFALVIHELATNAMKYGSLSKPDGRIEVTWTVDEQEEPTFGLVWAEHGGPSVSMPTRRGFGTRLVTATLGSLGDVDIRFSSSGLTVALSAPLSKLTHSVVPG